MIYYITGRDKTNGNEWIISSHDNAERAAHYLENYRATSTDDNVEFRIDTVLTGDEVKEVNARNIPAIRPRQAGKNSELKARLNAEFGKAKMDHEEGYSDSDSIRTEDFKWLELFPVEADGFSSDHCQECGSTVVGRFQRKHVDWHNKLLP